MRMFRTIGLSGSVLALGLVSTALLGGCGEDVPKEAATPIPIANPTADNPNKDVTLENESGKMKGVKSQLKGAAPAK